jgi:hypothetical protein
MRMFWKEFGFVCRTEHRYDWLSGTDCDMHGRRIDANEQIAKFGQCSKVGKTLRLSS